MADGVNTVDTTHVDLHLGFGLGVGNTTIQGTSAGPMGGMSFDIREGLSVDFERLVGPVGARLEVQGVLGTAHQKSKTGEGSRFRDWNIQGIFSPSLTLNTDKFTLGGGPLGGLTEHIPPKESASVGIGSEHVMLEDLYFTSHFLSGGQLFFQPPLWEKSVQFSVYYYQSNGGVAVGKLRGYGVEGVSGEVKRGDIKFLVTKHVRL